MLYFKRLCVCVCVCVYGARGGAVGWGTALQAWRSRARFPMVSLDFRPHYGPGVDSAFNRNEYQECFLGVKAAGALDWQPYYLRVPNVLKSGSLNLLESSGPAQACNGIYIYIYIYIRKCKSWVMVILITKEVWPVKTSITFTQSTQCHIPEDWHFLHYCCEDLKSPFFFITCSGRISRKMPAVVRAGYLMCL